MNQEEIMNEQLAAMDDLNTELGELERLRDEFAKAALQGMLADHTRDMHPYEFAQQAYVLADAMMKARDE
jgi:hypothetical protein